MWSRPGRGNLFLAYGLEGYTESWIVQSADTNSPSLQKKIDDQEANLVQKESMNAPSNIEVSEKPRLKPRSPPSKWADREYLECIGMSYMIS